MYTSQVELINSLDDEITRFVIKFYGFDSSTNHYTHKIVAVFDNVTEFKSSLDELQIQLASNQLDNSKLKKVAYYSGMVFPPGHLQRIQNRRFIMRAMKHGVDISNFKISDSIAGEIKKFSKRSKKSKNDT
jgi:hypothetical protein